MSINQGAGRAPSPKTGSGGHDHDHCIVALHVPPGFRPGQPLKQRIECPACHRRFYTRARRGSVIECPKCLPAGVRVSMRVSGARSQQPDILSIDLTIRLDGGAR